MVAALPKHDVFRAVADVNRRTLLEWLAEREMSVAEIARHFRISRTAVVNHLRVLHDAQLVRVRRAGRETRYKLRPEPLLELWQWLAFFEHFWQDKLASLQQAVEHPETKAPAGRSGTTGGAGHQPGP